MAEVETMVLAPAADVPNSPLPVVLYRDAFPAGAGLADRLEGLFRSNGWGGIWHNGIFPYQHFHDDAHEVLGIARGEATVQLGGASGPEVTVRAGDVVVLPAGTGHKRLAASADLLVIGGYPPGQEGPSVLRPAGESLASLTARCAAVALPGTDPVEGAGGTLIRLWCSPAGAA
jgi:uncharacterized protein YjlB